MSTNETTNCPYCLCPISESEASVRCPKCGVIHHSECWKTNGSCSVYGCDGWAEWSEEINAKIAPNAATEVELSTEDTVQTSIRETVKCIECGKEVSRGQLICWDCKRKQQRHFFDSCFGTGMLFIAAMISITAILVKVLA